MAEARSKEQGAGSREQRTESYNELQIDAWRVIEELVGREPEGATIEMLAEALKFHPAKVRRILTTWEALHLVLNRGGFYSLTSHLTHTLPGRIVRNHIDRIMSLSAPAAISNAHLADLSRKIIENNVVGEESGAKDTKVE